MEKDENMKNLMLRSFQAYLFAAAITGSLYKLLCVSDGKEFWKMLGLNIMLLLLGIIWVKLSQFKIKFSK